MKRLTTLALVVPIAGAATLLVSDGFTDAEDTTVEEGDTLSELAADHYGSGDWTTVMAIADLNGIADPNLIYVGDVIEFPDKIAQNYTNSAPVEEETVEHEPGTDWDGDGVIEPEPGTEEEAEYIEETYVEEEDDYTAEPSFDYGMWEPIIQCESGGNWYIDSTFDGGLQFHPDTWDGYGGDEYADYAYQAEPWEQIAIAERVLAGQGWQAWPSCAAQAGYL